MPVGSSVNPQQVDVLDEEAVAKRELHRGERMSLVGGLLSLVKETCFGRAATSFGRVASRFW